MQMRQHTQPLPYALYHITITYCKKKINGTKLIQTHLSHLRSCLSRELNDFFQLVILIPQYSTHTKVQLCAHT